MTAICHRHKFVYFPIPKNATSSIKRVMYQLETDRVWDKKESKLLGVNIHAVYPTHAGSVWKRYFDTYTSLVIVREPISRFLSAYGNRVVHAKILQMNDSIALKVKRARLSPAPDLDEFIAKFEDYRSISREVDIHTLPQARFVGKFWEKITYRLPINNVTQVPGIIEKHTGMKIELPYTQTGGPKFSADQLSSKQTKILQKVYRDDYKMFAGFLSFSKPF